MGYVLLALLILELLLFYSLNGKNIVSPSFLGCSMFILSTVFYVSAEEYYGYEISSLTVCVIIGLLMCIFLGELLANRVRFPASDRVARMNRQPLKIQWIICLLFAAFVLAMGVLRFMEVYRFSLRVGNEPGNFETMTKFVRSAPYNGYAAYSSSTIVAQGSLLSECLLYFCVYCFCRDRNAAGKRYWRYLLTVVCYVPHIMASDNRTDLLRAVSICCIIIFVFMKQKNGWNSKGNLKLIAIGVGAIALFLWAFRMLGYRTETSLRSEVWDNITEYTSASLVGLDKYLLNGEAADTLFGQGTLKNIYAILRQWGLPIPKVAQFEEFFNYAQGKSNIYTAFKVYIKDYSFIGAMAAMFLWGVVVGGSMNYIRQRGAGFIGLCAVGLLFYPVVMISIEDVTAAVLAIRTAYFMVYVVLVELVFVKLRLRLVCTGRGSGFRQI